MRRVRTLICACGESVHVRSRKLHMILTSACLLAHRYWRQEEDGSFFVIFQSTSHASRPPREGVVRASVPLSSIIIIPQRPEKSGRGNPQSLVTVLLSYDPKSWGSLWTTYMNSLAFIKPVVASLVAFRDRMARLDFIDPHLTTDAPAAAVQSAVGMSGRYSCACGNRGVTRE